jgi:1,4-alpha-glucan branching enzyme
MTLVIAPPLTDFDVHLFSEGTHYRLYQKLGAHVVRTDGNGQVSTHFAVWAPRARQVSVVGDFNSWNPHATPMHLRSHSGLWECHVPGIGTGARYKYSIQPRTDDRPLLKADPFAFQSEVRPGNASIVFDLDGYSWGDADWMTHRARIQSLDRPISIYEVHLGSWMRLPEQGNRWLSYREIAPRLADYVAEMGFTHVELLPIAEHPLDASWGYQVTGYFAPTSRYGSPHDLMFLIDTLHQRGIGVILDWVPAHFPSDPHGLASFDGQPLFEDPHPVRGLNPAWGTLVFHYERPEVSSFLLSNALYWLDLYHVDGLRVDAVSPMIFLDFARKPGTWPPNRFGGRENLEAIAFLQKFNDLVHSQHPGILTIAEESAAYPKVTRPTGGGGLGFDLKWDLGWMHDTLIEYMPLDPLQRKHAHNKLTFRMVYAFDENYVLVLSHDEVGHPKTSLLARMPGDDWRKFANLRLLFGYMYALSGKKLLFMGDEFGQATSWNTNSGLDWSCLNDSRHAGTRRWVRDLNTLYRQEPSLHQLDCQREGFAWVDCNDAAQSVLCMLRKGVAPWDTILLICNFTPIPHQNYRVGVPQGGRWDEILNSDAALYGGSGQGNLGGVEAAPVPAHGFRQSLNLVLPPLGMIALKRR